MYRRIYEVKPWAALYSTKGWKALRRHQLDKHPLCSYCLNLNKYTPADTVDHIQPHKGNKGLFYDPANLQSMCKKCHDSAKASEENRGHAIGCDPMGNPIDTKHHWNQ